LKITRLFVFAILLSAFAVPMAKAEIEINQVNIANVVISTPPNYGAARFTLIATKAAGMEESSTVPVVVNGTTISSIGIIMKADEIRKSGSANTTFPNASVLMVNPFSSLKPIPSDVVYPKSLNPYMNPISSIQYDVKVGNGPMTRITLLVYPDWTLWAIIVDIIVVVISALLIRQFSKA